MEVWASLASSGMANAINGLSEMIGQEIITSSLRTRTVAVHDAADVLSGAETIVTAVHLSISGGAHGHMVLVYPPEVSFALVDLVMGQEPGTTKELDEMEFSVLGEVGNIMGALFLNHVADYTGLELKPSPPEVMTDMVGAIIDAALADLLLYSDEIVVVTACFGTEGQQIDGNFLVLPSPEVIDSIARTHGSA